MISCSINHLSLLLIFKIMLTNLSLLHFCISFIIFFFSLLVLMWLPEALNTHVALVRCILDSTALTNPAQFLNTFGDRFTVLVF